jgi:hypothetical protein
MKNDERRFFDRNGSTDWKNRHTCKQPGGLVARERARKKSEK